MKQTVLIVDDHKPFRAQARALLEDEGYRVVGEAGDGGSGVAAALAFKPELILLDVQLPDTNGFDVAARLSKQIPGTTVVLISGRDSADYRAKLAGKDAPRFMAKSRFSGEALTALLEEAG